MQHAASDSFVCAASVSQVTSTEESPSPHRYHFVCLDGVHITEAQNQLALAASPFD